MPPLRRAPRMPVPPGRTPSTSGLPTQPQRGPTMPIPSSKPGTKIAAARQELEAVLVKLAEARSSYARWEATALTERCRAAKEQLLAADAPDSVAVTMLGSGSKLIDQAKIFKQSKETAAKFWKASSIAAGAATLTDGSPFRFIAETGTKATAHHDGALLEQIDLSTWVTMSIQRAVDKVQSRLQDGLSFLATVGSTSPFIGLFGTVWGIYNALINIGMTGNASIDKVAGPVGEALIMTAFGLFVAVPAVLGYNWLVRRNKSAMEDVRAFSADVHSVLISGAMSTADSAIRAGGAKKIG
eukprot:gene31238-35261_t